MDFNIYSPKGNLKRMLEVVPNLTKNLRMITESGQKVTNLVYKIGTPEDGVDLRAEIRESSNAMNMLLEATNVLLKSEIFLSNNTKVVKVEDPGHDILSDSVPSSLTEVFNVILQRDSYSFGFNIMNGITNEKVKQGNYVSEITTGGPAERADIHLGDLILKVNETEVSALNCDEVDKILQKLGKTVNFTFSRKLPSQEEREDNLLCKRKDLCPKVNGTIRWTPYHIKKKQSSFDVKNLPSQGYNAIKQLRLNGDDLHLFNEFKLDIEGKFYSTFQEKAEALNKHTYPTVSYMTFSHWASAANIFNQNMKNIFYQNIRHTFGAKYGELKMIIDDLAKLFDVPYIIILKKFSFA